MPDRALLIALLVFALVFQTVWLFSTAPERESDVIGRRLASGGLRAWEAGGYPTFSVLRRRRYSRLPWLDAVLERFRPRRQSEPTVDASRTSGAGRRVRVHSDRCRHVGWARGRPARPRRADSTSALGRHRIPLLSGSTGVASAARRAPSVGVRGWPGGCPRSHRGQSARRLRPRARADRRHPIYLRALRRGVWRGLAGNQPGRRYRRSADAHDRPGQKRGRHPAGYRPSRCSAVPAATWSRCSAR